MEILNLIAKVSWETNTKALESMSAEMKRQDGTLDELRRKGQRLNEQLIKTNDPKKVKTLNDELQKTKKSVDSIVESQKKQATALDSLNKKQGELISKLQKTNDPQLVQGLLRNLRQVENQMSVLDKQASNLPGKIGNIGKQLLEGLGVGAGMFGLQAGMQAISGFIGGAIEEFEDAQKTSLDLDRALKVIGKSKYFEGLKKEADSLAVSFHGLFDNDEIIKAQTALVQYGKLSREEMSKLLPIIMNLASAEGIDLANATEKVVNILEGRGGQTLRDYGVTVKGVKTEHDRLNVVLGDFQTKLSGAADTYATTAQGIEQTNRVLLSNIEENFGQSFSKLKMKVLPIITEILNGVNDFFDAESNFNKGVGNFVGGIMPGVNVLSNVNSNSETSRIIQQKKREDALKAIFKGKTDSGALNPNANLSSDDEETKKVVKNTSKKVNDEAAKKENEIRMKVKLYLKNFRGNQTNQDDIEGEVANFTKAIAEAQRKAEQRQSAAFESDAKRESMLGIPSTNDVDAAKITQEILNEQYRKKEEERTKIAEEESKKRRDIAKEELFIDAVSFANELSNLYSQEVRAIDKVIAAQEKRVESAKNASDKSLQIEQARLDELVRKRDKYERQQRTIDAAVIIANQAVAISGAVKTIASGGNPVLIAANVLAILAGITASVGAIRSINADAAQGFKDGGYTGDGDPSDTSNALGNRGYKYHKKEFVMNEHLTSKHRDMLEGMHKGELVVNRMADGYYLTNRTIDTDKAISDYYSVKNHIDMRGMESQLQSINEKLQGFKVNVHNNLDVDGFSMKVATGMGRLSILNKQRGG